MSRRNYNPEEIAAELRQVDVPRCQGTTIAYEIRQIGTSIPCSVRGWTSRRVDA